MSKQLVRFIVYASGLGVLFAACLSVAAQSPRTFAETSAATQQVAERYFSAYIARDWNTLEPLLATDGMFSDPTAEAVFGKVENIGKQAVMKNFRENYAAIQHMHFNTMRVVFSGSHAVFEGTLDWTLNLQNGRDAVTTGMPYLAILRVEGNQVVEHTDFADYQPFIEARRKARTGS